MVSTSIATVNTSTLPAPRVTPPIRAVPVPVATCILVAPVEVIAGETGKVVIVDQCLFSFTYDDTQYANGGAVSLVEETSGTVLTDGLSAGEVNGTADVLKQVSAKDCVRISDKGVFITNADAPFITGNSTIKLFIRYRLITL